MISHPNRSKQPIPVYAKGGFKVREQKPLGFAKDKQEANDIVRKNVPNIHGGANGGTFKNVVMGVELLADDEGRYYIPIRQIREI